MRCTQINLPSKAFFLITTLAVALLFSCNTSSKKNVIVNTTPKPSLQPLASPSTQSNPGDQEFINGNVAASPRPSSQPPASPSTQPSLPPSTAVVVPPQGDTTIPTEPQPSQQPWPSASPVSTSSVAVPTPSPKPPASNTSIPAGGSTVITSAGSVRISELTLTLPAGWSVAQQAVNEGIGIVGLANAEKYVTIYAKPGIGLSMNSLFVNGAQVRGAERTQRVGAYDWRLIDTTKTVPNRVPMAGTYYVTGFLLEKNGQSYYGYSRATSAAAAAAQVEEILNSLQ